MLSALAVMSESEMEVSTVVDADSAADAFPRA